MLFILPKKHFFVLLKFQIFAQSTSPLFSFVGYRWIHRISPFKIFRSGARHKSRLSYVNVFSRHYGGQLKTLVE